MARGPNRAPGRFVVADVERRTDDRHVGSPRLQLFGLGEKRPVPERRHPGVGQVELLDHSRRKLSLMIVVVAH